MTVIIVLRYLLLIFMTEVNFLALYCTLKKTFFNPKCFLESQMPPLLESSSSDCLAMPVIHLNIYKDINNILSVPNKIIEKLKED